MIASLAAGAGKGLGEVVLNAQRYVGKGVGALGDSFAPAPTLSSVITGGRPTNIAQRAGQWLQTDAEQGLHNMEGEIAPYKDAHPIATSTGEIGGNIVGTAPAGGALGQLVKAFGLTRLGSAIASGGMTTGAEVAPTAGRKTRRHGHPHGGRRDQRRRVGGLVEPDAATTGAVIGAALPPVAKAAGAAGGALGSLAVRPFTKSGQETDRRQTRCASSPRTRKRWRTCAPRREVVPGSAPTAVHAAGDEGLAGLSRTLQSADPRYAAELVDVAHGAQNAARTAALEDVAGNTGKLALAREARDAATGPMREAVLDAAGQRAGAPGARRASTACWHGARQRREDGAGRPVEVRGRIAQFAPEGQIDARALYAIRKDINDTL
jgi:hypothetical protein